MTVERPRSSRLVVVACLTTASWLLAGCVAVPDPNRAAPNPEAAPSFDSRTAPTKTTNDDTSKQRRSRVRFELAVAYFQRGQLDTAEATLKRAYDLDPTSPVIGVNLAEVLYQRGDYDRARFYIRRVNQNDETANAQSLWLGARIEVKLHNQNGANDLGLKLRNRFPKSRESLLFDRGAFNE